MYDELGKNTKGSKILNLKNSSARHDTKLEPDLYTFPPPRCRLTNDMCRKCVFALKES